MEAQAVPYYRAAIRQRLANDRLRAAYVGLGSSYRVLGQYEKSRRILESGLRKFWQANEMWVFLAMTLHELGRHRESVSLLLRVMADTTSDGGIKDYDRAIRFYAKNMNQTPKQRRTRGTGKASGGRHVIAKGQPGKIAAEKPRHSYR
jgi:tetratricopeptide (TPR) repeat protein